jgi:hypothetical protein
MPKVFASPRLLALASALFALTQTGSAGSVLRQDRAWKVYLNRATGFCVSYPSRWMRSETYDGAGLAVTTGLKKHSPIPIGSMDVSAFPLPESSSKSVAFAFDDAFELQLAGLKKFVRAERVEILEKRVLTLGTVPGLFAKVRYFDPRDRREWVDEIIFTGRDHLSYRLELETRADQLQRFEANFAQFVNSFQTSCGGAATPRSPLTAVAFRPAP